MGDVQYVRDIPDPRRAIRVVGTDKCRSRALYRLPLSVHFAGDGAVSHCLYVSGRRQRGSRSLFGVSLKSVRDFCFAAAGRAIDEHAWRGRQSGTGGQNLPAVAAAICAGSSFSPMDWRLCGEK
ncbi:hypothetical protein D3C87_1656460 [compost metagenome]